MSIDIEKQLSLLEYWHKLECFTPYELDIDSYTSIFPQSTLPWVTGATSSDDDVKYYRLFLGVFLVSEAKTLIEQKLGKESSFKPNDDDDLKGKRTCFCEAKVDKNGKYIDHSIKFSTMPWAIGKVNKNQLTTPNWSTEFQSFGKTMRIIIEEILTKNCDYFSFNEVITLLFNELGWRPNNWNYDNANVLSPVLILPVRFQSNNNNKETKQEAETSTQGVELCDDDKNEFQVEDTLGPAKSQNSSVDDDEVADDELEILNSFFINDLERVMLAIRENQVGSTLNDFLDYSKSKQRCDLEHDLHEVSEALLPHLFRTGRWPFPVDRSLSLMQQVAVNLIHRELSDNSALFSVNGPPGTGKTTLLSDVFASVITKRAERLASYSQPEQAFVKTSYFQLDGQTYKHYIYDLAPGFEDYNMLVCSSNNGAVENITKELPDIKTIKTFVSEPGANYFREVAQSVFDENAWGIITAVLGNSNNRRKFANSFWSFQVNGIDDTSEGKANQTFMSDVLRDDYPTSAQNWNDVRQSFWEAKENLNKLLSKMEYWRGVMQTAEKLRNSKKELISKQNTLVSCLIKLRTDEAELKEQGDKARHHLELIREQFEAIQRCKHWWYTLFFWHQVVKNYQTTLSNCNSQRLEAIRYVQKLESCLEQNKLHHDECEKELQSVERDLCEIDRELNKLEKTLNEAEQTLRDNYPNEDYWNYHKTNRSKFQLASPWSFEELNLARTKMFLASLELHKAFIEGTKKQVRNNLKALILYFTGKIPRSKIQPYLSTVWNTLFLVVPIISATFASIARMFPDMGKESIGWLFIDEAGQAVPQAAVGAIWRSKRVIVVGDPMQIEPVVTIHDRVIQILQEYYHVPDFIANKACSVQTIADYANKYGTYLGTDERRWIGSPLYVHRRCIEPMFSISNRSAYDDLMVFGTSSPEPNNTFPIKQSCWIDVKGPVEGKHWVPAQGVVIEQLVRIAIAVENRLPSLYIISPFIEVTRKLKSQLREIYPEFTNLVSRSFYTSWINTSVGTVHTFQGKQADNVIFCLGLDNTKGGAAVWASSSPNILNVAATRAKYRFCIVGDKTLWGTMPYFQLAAKLLNS